VIVHGSPVARLWINLSTPSLGITSFVCRATSKPSELSTPSLGITKVYTKEELLTIPFLSTPSLGITLDSYYGQSGTTIAFNSLSRDHEIKVIRPGTNKEFQFATFNSLSRDHM